MIQELYKDYINKSRAFLYPLLGIDKFSYPVPIETYIEWENKYTIDDKRLIVIYQPLTKDIMMMLEKKLLLHPIIEDMQQIDDITIICVFNFNASEYKNEFDLFAKGKYSLFSDKAKDVIIKYYRRTSYEYEYIDSYLNPNKYYDVYASLLGVNKEDLVELCSKYDEQKEICKLII